MTDNNYTPDTPQPNPDLKSLDRLVGTWNVFDPSRAEGVHGKVTYEWMEGGFFLIQRVDLENDGRTRKASRSSGMNSNLEPNQARR